MAGPDDRVLTFIDGTRVPVPDSIPNYVLDMVREKYADVLAPDPTLLGALGQGIMGIPRGFVKTAALGGRGLAEILPGDMGGADLATDILQADVLQAPVQYQDSFLTQLGEGIGSIGAFALPGGIARAAPYAVGALFGVGQQAADMDRVKAETGREIDPAQRLAAILGGAAIGTTEALPVSGMVGDIRRAASIGARRAVSREAAREAREGAIKSALKAGLGEGTQEITASLGQNIVSKMTFDPAREITPDISEFTVGGAAGAIFDFVGSAAARNYRRSQRALDYATEHNMRVGDLVAEAPLVIQRASDAMDASGSDDPTQFAREFDVVPAANGMFQVVDAKTREPLAEARTAQEAAALGDKLAAEQADLIYAAQVVPSMRYQGYTAVPQASIAAYEALHRDLNGVPIGMVASHLSGDLTNIWRTRDPLSAIGVDNLNRGLTEAQEADIQSDEIGLGLSEDWLAEMVRQAPAYVANSAKAPAVTKDSGEFVNAPGRPFDFAIGRRVYQIRPVGETLGFAVFAPNTVVGDALEGRKALGFAEDIEAAKDLARSIERKDRRLRAQNERAKQQKIIDEMIAERKASIEAARARLAKLESKLAKNKDDQPNYNRLRQMTESGRSLLTMQETRDILGNKGMEDLLFNITGLTVAQRGTIARELRKAPRTKDGRIKQPNRVSDTEAIVKQQGAEFLEKVRESGGDLVDMDKAKAMSIGADTLTGALREKGWATRKKYVAEYAEALLGKPVDPRLEKFHPKNNPSGLTPGEYAYLLSRFNSMTPGDTRSQDTHIPLPDPRPIPYTPEQYDAVMSTIAQQYVGADGKPNAYNPRREALVSRVVEDLENSGQFVTRQQIDRVIDHALRAGRLTTTGGKKGGSPTGIKFVSQDAALEMRQPDDMAVAEVANAMARRLGYDEPTAGQRAIAEDIVMSAKRAGEAAAAAAEEYAKKNGTRVNPAAAASVSKRVEEAAVQNLTDIQILEMELGKLIKDGMGMKLTDAQKARFEVLVAENMDKLAELAGKDAVASGLRDDAVAVFVTKPGSPLKIIFNLKAIDPEGTMSNAERLQAMRPTAVYETSRLLFDQDFINQEEKDKALRASNKLVTPRGRTYYQEASDLVNQNQKLKEGDVGFAEYVTEQAVALMAMDASQGHPIGVRPSDTPSAVGKVMSAIKSFMDFGNQADIMETSDLIRRIVKGEIDRDPGLGKLNPDAQNADIRSLRQLSTRGRPAANTAAVVGPDTGEGEGEDTGPPSVAPAAEGSAAGAVDEAPADQPAPAVRQVQPLTDERRQELETLRDDRIATDLKSKLVPLHGPNTSAEAMDAYENAPDMSVSQGRAKLNDQTIRYRTQGDAGTDPMDGRYGYTVEYAPVAETIFQRFMKAIKTLGWYDALRGDEGRKLFDDVRRGIRSQILDGRNEAEKVDKMYAAFVADKEGVTLLADQMASTMLRAGDRLSQLTSEGFRGGAVRYVQGTRDVLGQMVRSTNQLAGHFMIDRNVVFKTSSGKEYRSLLEILREPYSRKAEGEKRFHDYLIRLRTLQIVDEAQAASLRLAKGDYATPRERAELERRVRLGDPENLPQPKGYKGDIIAESREFVDYVRDTGELQWMVDAQEGLVQWNNSLLQMLYDTGVLSSDQFDAWYDKVYVPFTKAYKDGVFRGDVFESPGAKKAKKEPKKASRTMRVEVKLRGSGQQIDTDLFTDLFENYQAITHDAITNAAHARMAKMLEEMGYGSHVTEDSKEGQVRSPWQVRYLENGEERILHIDPEKFPDAPHLIAAMQFSGEDFFSGVVGWLPKAANLLRQGVTRMPTFIARNLFKDTVSIYVTSGSNFRPVLDTLRHASPALLGHESEMFEIAKQAGIALETDNLNDRNRHAPVLRRILAQEQHKAEHDWDVPSAILRSWDYLGDLSRQSDTATRMAVYERVLAETGNEAEAVHQALEVINYGRRGRNPVWRLVTASIPFLNARMQGLDIMYRSAFGKYSAANLDADGKRRAAKALAQQFWWRGAYLFGLTAAYYMAVHDEDWYKNLRDEVKDNYWIIPIAPDVAIRIPTPFEVGLFFKTIPEQLLRTMNEDGYTGAEFGADFAKAVTQTTMFSPMPQIMAPLFDAWRNYNSFTQSPIVPTYMEDGLPAMDRRTADTTRTAEMLAAIASSVPGINIDPMRMQYIVNGYTGTMGQYALALMDMATRHESVREIFNAVPFLEDVREPMSQGLVGTRRDPGSIMSWPLAGDMLQDLNRGGGYQQDFYEMRTRLNRTVAAINAAQEDGRQQDYLSLQHEYAAIMNTEGMVRRLDKYMAKWRERRDRILRTDMPSRRKRLYLEELEKERDVQLAIVPFLKEISSKSGLVP